MGRSMGTPASQQTSTTPDLATVTKAAVASPSGAATPSGEGQTASPPVQPGPNNEFRQRAARASLVHAVMCRYAGATDFVEVTTLNISQSGMLFHGDTLPAVGTELEFKFILENGFELLSGTAKVMRHAVAPNGSPSAGVAFGLMEPPVQRILARVIEIHTEIARS
ncbi:MAG TPA: PilZ domain-containing protein [Polyangia bacterium]